jgi:carbonic anhydrase
MSSEARVSDPQQAVIDDVARIRNHPLVPRAIPIYGYIYDVKTGKLIEVEQATQIGVADSISETRVREEVSA